MNPQDQIPVFVSAQDGVPIDFISVTHKLTGRQTGGAYYVFESLFDGVTGNRLHVHSREDEYAFVIDGALEVRLAEEIHILEAGGMAHLPKGIPHALRNPLETPSRYLFMSVPAGLDRLFDAFDAARQAGTLDDAEHRRLSREFGLEWLE